MSVLGTPEKPKPPTRTVELLFSPPMASVTDEEILSILRNEVEPEKLR